MVDLAETYRAAASRCFTLADAEANDLVKGALETAGQGFIRTMLQHQQTTMDLPVRGRLI